MVSSCMPDKLKVVGNPPMVCDAPSLRWFADAKALQTETDHHCP